MRAATICLRTPLSELIDECLDSQILFDPAEENLDLPALLIDIGDGLGRKFEVIG